MDGIDRMLLAELQRDALQPYAALGASVGLSAGAAHERVRKLRDRGVIRRTAVDVDPAAAGRGLLGYLLVDGDGWLGGDATARALARIPAVIAAHVVTGGTSLLVTVRVNGVDGLPPVLRDMYAIDRVSGVRTVLVLETLFERPVPLT